MSLNIDSEDDLFIKYDNELDVDIFKKSVKKLTQGKMQLSSTASSSSSSIAAEKPSEMKKQPTTNQLKPKPKTSQNDEKKIFIRKQQLLGTKKVPSPGNDSLAKNYNADRMESAIQESISFSDKLRVS